MNTEIETLRTMVTDLRIERDALGTDYELLSDNYRALVNDNEVLRTRNSQLIAEREVFRTAIRELRTENEELSAASQVTKTTLGIQSDIIEGLQHENEGLVENVDELRIRCAELGG